MTPRRVLMTADAVGGVWTQVLDLAAALAEGGTAVTLAVLGPPPGAAQRAEARAVPGLELVELPGRLEWMADPEADVARHGAALLALEERLAPDIVHLNGFAHAALPWRAPCLVTAHSCVGTWWRAVHGDDPPAAWDGYRERVRAGLAAADAVVAPSRAFLDDILALYHPRRPAMPIHNGRREGLFAPTAAEPFVLGAGRWWDAAKNLPALAAAAARIAWPVVLAGPLAGPDGEAVDPGAAHALGTVDGPGMRRLMARAAIFAGPARYEPFGLAALEAGSSGCALVLGDLASQREIWGDGAVYVDPEDGEALAAALARLIADPGRRRRMAWRARERAATLTARRMAEGYRAAYGRVAREWRRREKEGLCASPCSTTP